MKYDVSLYECMHTPPVKFREDEFKGGYFNYKNVSFVLRYKDLVYFKIGNLSDYDHDYDWMKPKEYEDVRLMIDHVL